MAKVVIKPSNPSPTPSIKDKVAEKAKVEKISKDQTINQKAKETTKAK